MLPSLRLAITAVLGAAIPLSHCMGQVPHRRSKDAAAALVDSMVRAAMAEQGSASVSVAITRGSETLVQRAWGVADVAANRPATTGSTYRIGSISKQFTAALLLKQVERGKLSLSDSIGRYLTGLRPEWRPITIEQLLTHTAGMQPDFRPRNRSTEEVPADTLIAWAARDTLAYPPGTRHAYSNTGYMLLGVLVQTLYGKPYGDALREEIARPLGLTTLGWCADAEKRKTETTGYEILASGERQPAVYTHPSQSLGAGGLCASAADLTAWNRALHGGRALSPAS
jgi:D-alanyl-D-alanine carboxypeptidase